MLLNEQTWETGLSSRQDEEWKGIHESSDEFHEWKIKSWKWWKEHTKERNEKREWAFEERCENQKAHEIPDVSEQKESHKNMERVQQGDTTKEMRITTKKWPKEGQKWKWSQRWQKRERENCTTRDKQNFENKSKVRTTMWTNRQKEEERAE